MATKSVKKDPSKLRSRKWFANPDNPNMTALYLERYMNFGLKREELQAGKPIIGIAQSGSDLSPCNRHHLELAHRVREGIREAGGIAFEFPVHPIQETGKRPTAALDRNLCYLGLVETLYGYFIDGVVLTTGCDKTTPAQLMAAATVDIPAIVLSGGPMLNGWFRGERTGSGTIVWKARELLAAGEINAEEFIELVASSAPSAGHCNTMGTASTMNSLAEALGMSLPGGAAIPAPHKDRAVNAYESGKRIVEMVWEDLRPSKIMTREAFENVIVVNSAIGGSTNAPIHFNAIARHIGVQLDNDDWEKIGYDIPLLVNLQPAGEYLGEEYHRAGGVPAVVGELIRAGKIRKNTLTVNGKTLHENCKNARIEDEKVIWPYEKPMKKQAGFLNLKGNLFDSAIMKTSVISDAFRKRYLSNPKDPNAFEGQGDRVRRPGGLPSPHRRSEARDRRHLHAVRARHRSGRLSGRGRSGEHAAARGADQARRDRIALHRRRAAVGHVGFAFDPECLSGGGNGRRPCDPEDRRSDSHRSQQAHRQYSDQQGGVREPQEGAREAGRIQDSRQPDSLAGNPARHRGRAFARDGAEAGGQVSADRDDQGNAEGQPLRACGGVGSWPLQREYDNVIGSQGRR